MRAYNSTKKILAQVEWSKLSKQVLWTHIVANKISNQANCMEKFGCAGKEKLMQYIEEIELDDETNREGHAAKVYFNSLFGKDFSRGGTSAESKALDYGYIVLLSAFNRAVSNLGYVNQLGIKHKNEFNAFNLACDLIEPFRVLVDDVVLQNRGRLLDTEYKQELVNILNKEIKFNDKNMYVINAIPIFIGSCVAILEGKSVEYIAYEFEV